MLRAYVALFFLLLAAIVMSRPSAPPLATAAAADIPPAASPDWDPACYSTYSQIESFLMSQAAQYPHIATLLDAGSSWEGTRHLYTLQLGSTAVPGPKPSILLVAGQHPRDIATTEMLIRLVSYLTQNYGLDPDVTWLLDTRTILILPTANPDGYVQVHVG